MPPRPSSVVISQGPMLIPGIKPPPGPVAPSAAPSGLVSSRDKSDGESFGRTTGAADDGSVVTAAVPGFGSRGAEGMEVETTIVPRSVSRKTAGNPLNKNAQKSTFAPAGESCFLSAIRKTVISSWWNDAQFCHSVCSAADTCRARRWRLSAVLRGRHDGARLLFR
jgi:hypothetical protein